MRKNIRKEDDDIQELLNRAKRIDSDNARQKKVDEAVAKFRAKYGEESESAKVAKEGFSIFRKKKREELNINIDDDEEDVYEEVAEKKDEFVEGVSEGSELAVYDYTNVVFAALLGFANYVVLSLATKCAPSSAAVFTPGASSSAAQTRVRSATGMASRRVTGRMP